jgi:hypothetical protein
MRYNPTGNNLGRIPTTSEKLRTLLRRKAQAGATYWTMNSVIRTGYNASHVQVLEGMNGDNTAMAAVIYANGHYAKWREIGSSRSGASAPEWVLRKSISTIRAA